MSKASIDLKSLGDSSSEDISALSCVFRAGRENALTDHSSILFDVDLNTGKIKKGSSNDNWYRIGLGNILTCPWRTNDEDQRVNSHPDVAEGGVIEGKKILQIEEMKDLVERSHAKMCPDVPFVGWDVVLSSDKKCKICLLEVNLSCNFFRGSFDKDVYYDFIDESYKALSKNVKW